MQLTKAEEQVMQILWDLGEDLVKDIREQFDDPKPAMNTFSTVLRVLEKNGFTNNLALGNIHFYFPLISRTNYSRRFIFRLMKGFRQLFPGHGVIFCTRERAFHKRAQGAA